MTDWIERRIEAILATANKSRGDDVRPEGLTPEQIVEKQENELITVLYYDAAESTGLSISEFIEIEDKVWSVAGDCVMTHIIFKCLFSVEMVRQLHTNLRKALAYRNLWESDREQCIAELGKFSDEVFQHIKDMADPNSKARKLSDILSTPTRPKMRLQDIKPVDDKQTEPTPADIHPDLSPEDPDSNPDYEELPEWKLEAWQYGMKLLDKYPESDVRSYYKKGVKSIGDAVAVWMKKENFLSAKGTPFKGSYIARHALGGLKKKWKQRQIQDRGKTGQSGAKKSLPH
jgi:hypothetical protein